jgi:hypothetical protein
MQIPKQHQLHCPPKMSTSSPLHDVCLFFSTSCDCQFSDRETTTYSLATPRNSLSELGSVSSSGRPHIVLSCSLPTHIPASNPCAYMYVQHNEGCVAALSTVRRGTRVDPRKLGSECHAAVAFDTYARKTDDSL